MPVIAATSARRRTIMVVLLVLAASGAVIRWLVPEPSTLRNLGTLMLVLWLPTVSNLIGYLRGKLPRPAPPPTGFAAGLPFSPQLTVRLAPTALAEGLVPAPQPEQLGTMLVGRRGFTVRFDEPLAQCLQVPAPTERPAELLRPAAAREYLPAGTRFHLLVGTDAVATGEVLDARFD